MSRILTVDVQEWMKAKCLEPGAQKFLNKRVKQEELCAARKEITGQTAGQEVPCT